MNGKNIIYMLRDYEDGRAYEISAVSVCDFTGKTLWVFDSKFGPIIASARAVVVGSDGTTYKYEDFSKLAMDIEKAKVESALEGLE